MIKNGIKFNKFLPILLPRYRCIDATIEHYFDFLDNNEKIKNKKECMTYLNKSLNSMFSSVCEKYVKNTKKSLPFDKFIVKSDTTNLCAVMVDSNNGKGYDYNEKNFNDYYDIFLIKNISLLHNDKLKYENAQWIFPNKIEIFGKEYAFGKDIVLNDAEMQFILSHELMHVVNKDINILETVLLEFILKPLCIITPIIMYYRTRKLRYFSLLASHPFLSQIGNYYQRKQEYSADLSAVKIFPELKDAALSFFTKLENTDNQKDLIKQIPLIVLIPFIFIGIMYGTTHPTNQQRIIHIKKNIKIIE